MKRILIAGYAVLFVSLVQAQQNQGKVTYERVSQMQARFNINGVENVMPQTRKDNFELTFGNNQSLWKAAEKDEADDMASGGEGMQVRMIVAGANDMMFTNLENGKRVQKREVFDKTFIVDDTVTKLKWKMTGETKVIQGHNCMKATSTNITTQTRMTVNDGKMERQDVQDTANITAWFATDIPVSAGPAEYQGQLPGLILEMDVNNGRQTYIAVTVSDKTDLTLIKEPTGKKHYTANEFKEERDKMMKEFQQNNSGGMRMRMN